MAVLLAMIKILDESLPSAVNGKTPNSDVYDFSVEKCERFKILFLKFSKCHNVYNSSRYLEQEDIQKLEADIEDFMAYLRTNFHEMTIIPKLHMLEDHMVPFILEWKVGCGFFGEQGGESIHASINTLKRNYSNIKKGTDELKYIMNSHLASTNPNSSIAKSTLLFVYIICGYIIF